MKFPEQFRFNDCAPQYQTKPCEPHGMFLVPHAVTRGRTLKIIASCGRDARLETGWEHVSVSIMGNRHACPTWEEMCLVKDLFWNDDECIVQFHPAKQNYVNHYPGCLHLWKSVNAPFPTPPTFCV